MIAIKGRIFSCGIVSLVVGAFAFAACGGSDGSALINGNPDADGGSDVTDDAGDSSAIAPDGNTDGGVDGGIAITDGGANFGDAGSDDDGGDFPDGGSCNRTALGDSIMSTCNAFSAFELGGALQNGNYTLTTVTDEGSFSFCQSTFVAVPFTGGAVISSGSGGASDIEVALDGDSSGRKSFSWSATPASGNQSPLSIAQTCPIATTLSLPYSTSSASIISKQSFEFVGPYGTGGGSAVYHFEKD